MERWREELRQVDWTALRLHMGDDASSIPDALERLERSRTLEEGWDAYWAIDNRIVVQANLQPAARAAVPFVVELVILGKDHVRRLALELLIQLAGGWTDPRAGVATDLAAECKSAARTGMAFYYSLLESEDEEIRDRAVELLGLLEQDPKRLTWTLRWVADHDPAPRIVELATKLLDRIV